MHMARRKRFDVRSIPREQQGLVLALLLFWSILSYLFITHFILGSVEVLGNSMSPTLTDGSVMLINRLAYRFRDPRRFDIVAVKLARYEDLTVKRVVALPLERVQLMNGRLLVNGRPLAEPYLGLPTWTASAALSNAIYEVAPDCYFLMGDNRTDSADSRVFGAVRRDAIVGRVMRHASLF